MKFRAPIGILSLLMFAQVLSGCATSRVSGWDWTYPPSTLNKAQERKLMSEGLRYWTRRHLKADLEKAIDKFEEVAKGNPKNYEALVLLCRGYYVMADGHTDSIDEKKALWNVGVTWGERAMAIDPKFRKIVIEGKKPLEAGLGALSRRYVDAIYWTAVNLGKWGKAEGIATILKYKGRVKKMIERVEKLDKRYFYGAVYRYWGVYYAVAPSFAGGSMEKSLANFQKSLRMANGYLGTHVLFAENYAVRKSDQATFKKELNFVLKANPNTLKDIMPEQIIEQRKAKKMLANMEEYF
jgi:tetratricopeptide (TPR) repeat protein